jgi:GT2 family glycosyltransferase
MNKLAILIPVYNGISYTRHCLDQLTKMVEPKEVGYTSEIVVIDDGSTDGTSEWIKKNHPGTTILLGNGSLFWSGAINLGVEHVLSNKSSEYILWWNNDIQPEGNYFKNLKGIFGKITDRIVAGSKIYDLVSGKVWGMGGRFNTQTGKKFQYAYYVEDSQDLEKELSVDWLPGMGTVAHYTIYEKVGLIDAHNFPQYHGDLDFTLRAKLHPFEVIVYPQLKIYNDTKSTGVKAKNNWGDVKKSLTSIKSLYNYRKDVALYKKFTSTPWSYPHLLSKYFMFLAGYFKWQVLGWLHIKR